MLPNQFSPLNSFGIDGDIFCSIKYDSRYNSINDISFYNTNPNKTYEYIDFPFNFNNTSIDTLNFYNFNQDYITLKLYKPDSFLRDTYNFKGFNSLTDIKLSFEYLVVRVFDYMFAYTESVATPDAELNLSNVIIMPLPSRPNLNEPQYTARYMFYGLDFFNEEKSFEKINIEFLYVSDLTACFAQPIEYYYSENTKKVNKSLTDLLIPDVKSFDPSKAPEPNITNIDYLLEYRTFDEYFDMLHPDGFIDTTHLNLSFPRLESAVTAFSQLAFTEHDIQNLLNLLPTKTDGAVHDIGFSKDGAITEDKINEYINQYNQKGWTVSLN